LSCLSAETLFDQLLSQPDGEIQCRMLPSLSEISSGIHHLPFSGRLACCPSPALTLCVSPNLCWVLIAPLGGWLVAPLLLSVFVPFPSSGVLPVPLGGWLPPHSFSQSLCLFQSLLGASSSSGRLACHSAPALSLCYFSCVSLRVQC
jgi:hypothetical protein